MKHFALLVIAGSILTGARAQTAGTADEWIQDWKTSRQFTLAVAEAMPADKYGFRVNDEEMKFGQLMFHIAFSQAFRFAQIAGTPMPFKPPEGPVDKAAVVDLLGRSFDYCIEQLQKFTPEQLARSYKVDWYERPEVTGRELILGMFTHTAGQAEVYLRASGIKPPPYRF